MRIKVFGGMAAATAIAAATFMVGRWSASGVARQHVSAAPEPAPSPAAAPAGVTRRFPRPLLAATSAPDATSSDEAVRLAELRFNRADFLLGQVFKELDVQGRFEVTSAETRAGAVLPYLSGVLHGALQADPEMRPALSRLFTAKLCGPRLADDQTISVAHMALALPDIATHEAFDCYFSKAKEDVPSWFMLDAWRRSGLPKSPALARLQASATDPRTMRRFLSDEQAAAERISKTVSNN